MPSQCADRRFERRPVTIVGQSLGGVYAREFAGLQPDAVRMVVTLSSPFGSFQPLSPLPDANIQEDGRRYTGTSARAEADCRSQDCAARALYGNLQ
ncbi:MAG: alpha/beta fold hydrolase [Pseudohongiellaceae bacterium]